MAELNASKSLLRPMPFPAARADEQKFFITISYDSNTNQWL
jgi:hypothetical protein